ncbi:MAG: DNA topoisomerase III [Limnohabitans sp.]
MSKTLVIAEKPSVAQDIVKALMPTAGKFEKHDDHFENDRFVVTSAVGHLVEIQAPEAFDVKRGKWSFAHLPVIPPYFDLKPVEKTKSRLAAVVKQAKRKDIGTIINACDAGREGELIFRLIEQYAGGKKPLDKPVQRLWLQSMTPQAIRDGFEQLRSSSQMQGLADAARSRSEADWLVGINGTRAFTAFNSRDGGFFLTTVGRVQTPTLSVVVEREEVIRRFVSRDYWEIHASFAAQAGAYAGKWFNPKHTPNADDKEIKEDRGWSLKQAQAIADAVKNQTASVTEESKPSSKGSPGLFDLTSVQREANGRFGFSAKTTLSLAQSLYERHKALTYPRTDSRHLPEDYLATVKDTMQMLAKSSMGHLAPFAKTALAEGYIKPSKKVFDNTKVSDHFAIIPTLQAPSGLSDAEQKLYDFVVRRFIAVFYPAAQFLDTTRIGLVQVSANTHHFKSTGRVMIDPGWQAIYGKEVDEEEDKESGKILVKLAAGETPSVSEAETKGLKTRPPARYTEATLLGAMESAGKHVEDDELREAMQEKGLGTPATRSSIIEGLLNEKYMLRDGRELIPTAKAFQLMTLLRGLGVEELSRADLTGDWEFKLSQMEKGKLSRDAFMQDIAEMTQRMVKKAKEYDRDTIPGDYATLQTPCPNCGGVVKENYRRYSCIGKPGAMAKTNADGESEGPGCGFSFGKTPAGRTFELAEVEQFLRDKKIGPLEGFRSKAGWPFTAEIALKFSDEEKNWKLDFDFGDDKNAENSGEIVEFGDAVTLGACPKCGSAVHEYGANYVCSKSVPTHAQPTPSCDFKTGRVILQQVIEHDQIQKLLATGKTDLLEKFVSMRTRRAFKAYLTYDAQAGKVSFAFEPSKYPRKGGAPTTAALAKAAGKTLPGKKTPAAKKASAKTAAAKTANTTQPKTPRKAAAGKAPSAALAAVIGNEAVARTEVMKKLWDYIKTHNLQDPKDKRTIRADDKLKAVFGKDSVGMFELAGLIGAHLD